MDVAAITDPTALRRFLAARFGSIPGEGEGVLHVAAVWRPPGEERNQTLRIRADTPKSETDFLLLNLARARAEAIVTTGRILREEPGVTHDLQGRPGIVRALAEWRREMLGSEQPPWLLVLTGGRDLDPAHPAFHAWARPLVCCPASRAGDVRSRLRGTAVEVAGHADPGLRAALAYLREARGARRISIEAGPSTAITAYREPAVIDELLLSVYGGDLAPELAGGELPRRADLEQALGPPRASFSAREASGPWTFEHYRSAGSGVDAAG